MVVARPITTSTGSVAIPAERKSGVTTLAASTPDESELLKNLIAITMIITE
jgi:hypothetical protein